jgi:hypothetical protein
VVALFTYFFADVDILLVTPLLSRAETAAIGLCLKLAMLVGFVVQVALVKALGFPLAITFSIFEAWFAVENCDSPNHTLPIDSPYSPPTSLPVLSHTSTESA